MKCPFSPPQHLHLHSNYRPGCVMPTCARKSSVCFLRIKRFLSSLKVIMPVTFKGPSILKPSYRISGRHNWKLCILIQLVPNKLWFLMQWLSLAARDGASGHKPGLFRYWRTKGAPEYVCWCWGEWDRKHCKGSFRASNPHKEQVVLADNCCINIRTLQFILQENLEWSAGFLCHICRVLHHSKVHGEELKSYSVL